MMKFQEMPLLLLPMSQKKNIGEIVDIFVFDHTYDTIERTFFARMLTQII